MILFWRCYWWLFHYGASKCGDSFQNIPDKYSLNLRFTVALEEMGITLLLRQSALLLLDGCNFYEVLLYIVSKIMLPLTSMQCILFCHLKNVSFISCIKKEAYCFLYKYMNQLFKSIYLAKLIGQNRYLKH